MIPSEQMTLWNFQARAALLRALFIVRVSARNRSHRKTRFGRLILVSCAGQNPPAFEDRRSVSSPQAGRPQVLFSILR
jgi:hypothetical protein